MTLPLATPASAPPRTRTLPTAELVVLLAGMMALNALAIDIVLPALPDLGASLKVDTPNHRQYVIIAYLYGLGIAQLGFGPASDRFGRRRPLLASLFGYSLFGAFCAVAPSFELLVVARALQGVAASGARVSAIAIVRDSFEGRQMAKVMSLVMMVFMAVPAIAPNIGQAVLLFAPWPWLFTVLVMVGAALALWAGLRLPETLPADQRKPLAVDSLGRAYREAATNRLSLGYTLARGTMFGTLMAFISSAEQVFSDTYGRPKTFTLYFAGVALTMALAALTNSRLVARFGMRRLAHSALVAFLAISYGHVAFQYWGGGGFIGFYTALVGCYFCFSFIGSNFNTVAMAPMGHIAGTASAFQGFLATVMSATLGGYIGQHFDGTARPMAVGFAVLGTVTLVIVAITERGVLFHSAPAVAGASRA